MQVSYGVQSSGGDWTSRAPLAWLCLEARVGSVPIAALKRNVGVEVLDCTHLMEFSRDDDHDLERRLSESHRGSGG
jgi:hypothetical protein